MPANLCRFANMIIDASTSDSAARDLNAFKRASADVPLCRMPTVGRRDWHVEDVVAQHRQQQAAFVSDLPEDDPRRDQEEQWLRRISQVIDQEGSTTVEASQMTEYLFIGGRTAATDVFNANTKGITHLCNLAEPWCAMGPNSAGIEYCGLCESEEAVHRCDQLLDPHKFDKIRAFVRKVKEDDGQKEEEEKKKKKQKKRCLVHDDRGINRSAVICAALLMDLEQMTLIEAVRHLKTTRGCVLGEVDYRLQLVRYAIATGHLLRDTVAVRPKSSGGGLRKSQSAEITPGDDASKGRPKTANDANRLAKDSSQEATTLLPSILISPSSPSTRGLSSDSSTGRSSPNSAATSTAALPPREAEADLLNAKNDLSPGQVPATKLPAALGAV